MPLSVRTSCLLTQECAPACGPNPGPRHGPRQGIAPLTSQLAWTTPGPWSHTGQGSACLGGVGVQAPGDPGRASCFLWLWGPSHPLSSLAVSISASVCLVPGPGPEPGSRWPLPCCSPGDRADPVPGQRAAWLGGSHPASESAPRPPLPPPTSTGPGTSNPHTPARVCHLRRRWSRFPSHCSLGSPSTLCLPPPRTGQRDARTCVPRAVPAGNPFACRGLSSPEWTWRPHAHTSAFWKPFQRTEPLPDPTPPAQGGGGFSGQVSCLLPCPHPVPTQRGRAHSGGFLRVETATRARHFGIL